MTSSVKSNNYNNTPKNTNLINKNTKLMESAMSNFNTTVIDFATQMASILPNSIISNNLDVVVSTVKKYPTKLIESFILYALKDKDKIDAGDDDYFLKKSYDEITEKDDDMMGSMFDLKTIWGSLNSENKEFVKGYMKYLCNEAMEYFLASGN